ncbi:MAG: YSC84-related protein [Phycisphaerales bacterium JB040]
MKTTRSMFGAALLACGLAGMLPVAGTLSGCTSAKGGSPEEKRDYVDRMTREALEAFYAEKPDLRNDVQSAPGYGLFSSIGTNLIFVATEGGHGKVHNNQTGKDTYMKVAGGGVGIGLGAKDYKMLMIFKTEYAMQDFIANGWSAGAEADAAAKSGDQGGEASAESNIEDDIVVHTLTENGLALSATIGATKFYKDDELN